jgi:hypothetical protein
MGLSVVIRHWNEVVSLGGACAEYAAFNPPLPSRVREEQTSMDMAAKARTFSHSLSHFALLD